MLPPPGAPRKRPAMSNAVPAAPAAPAPVAPPSAPAHLQPVPGKARNTGQALTSRQRAVTPSQEAAFATIEANIGGRRALISSLSTAHLPANMERLLGAIADPANDTVSLAKVCAAHDVGLSRLLEVFKAAALAHSQLKATLRIAEALPEVAAQVMEDALRGQRLCPDCLGAKLRPDPTAEAPNRTTPCDRCKGHGEIVYTPEHEVQKTALKMGKLLEGGGMKIAVNQQTLMVGGGAASEDYDRLIGALDGALYGHGRDRLRTGPAGPAGDPEDAVIEGETT